MKSEIIDRILSKNSEPLHEIIAVVKNNAVFQDVMSDIKEEFFIDDTKHGISHNERVALLSCYIGIQEGLTDEELKLVLEAAKYHDIGRGYEGNHGQYSTFIIDRNREYIFQDLNENEVNIIKALCHGHSVDDSKYEEIAKMYGIRNIDQFKKLLNIVKDADALDRVRLPRFGKLDEKYLRTETAHGMIELATNLFREYRSIQKEIPLEDKITESKYFFDADLRDQLLFDGENYYLLRSLNSADIDSLNNGNGIIPKIDNIGEHTAQDVMAQIRMQHRKTNLISMSEDPNIVLTYDKSNLHKFVLIKLSKKEIENSKKVFSAGEYLLGIMDSEIERIERNAPDRVREILENVDRATSIDEIVGIINGADRQVQTSLVETEQQYLSNLEQLNQSKKIAKCKVLNYYGLMRGIAHDEKGKLLDISEFTRIMRNGYSSSEWLYSGKISQDKIIIIPQILIDSLALLKQAEFQGKDKEILREIEQEVLRLAISGKEINQDNYKLEYSAHNVLKNDLTIDRAYEITNGQISYRDTNMQQIAIRKLAEMTLNKRKIIEVLKERLPSIDIEKLLSGTYCINQEMITKQNNRGSQIGRNIGFIISDYGYDFDEETSRKIIERVEILKDEQLNSIISQGIDALEIKEILKELGSQSERIKSSPKKSQMSKYYIAEAIVEGYNWKKDGNSLTKREKRLLLDTLIRGVKESDGLYRLYEAINIIQVGTKPFTQDEVYAIIINIAIDGKIGGIEYRELLNKSRRDIIETLLENQVELQTSVLEISIDVLAKRGRKIEKLKKELIDLGIDKDFIESKDIRNVYIAKKIVEEYNFKSSIGRDINQKEKVSLIKAVLNSDALNSKYSFYLTTLIRNFEQIGLSTSKIYGMIINLGVNGKVLKEAGYGYRGLLGNIDNNCQTINEYKDKIETRVTEGTVYTAISKNISDKDKEQIKQELIELGMNKDFIDQIDIRNIYIAKKIVEEYDFKSRIGRDINKKEKASLINAILNNNCLDHSLLTNLIQNMEQIGLATQEIYGMIINLGVNSKVLEEAGYAYSTLLLNQSYSRQSIEQFKDKIKTKVSEGTIYTAVSNNLTEKDQEQIQQELVNIGIDKDFIKSKGIKNTYIAKHIVEEYDFRNSIGRDITQKEKASMIYAILDNNSLSSSGSCLTTLIQNMEQIRLSTKKIYGMIINLGVNGKVIEEAGYGYRDLLGNFNNSCQTINKYKNKIETRVTKGTVYIASSNNISDKDKKQIKQELIELGMNKDFIDQKDIRNVYIAKKIVEEYDFESGIGKNLNQKEKASLIKAILNVNVLDSKYSYYLTTLIRNMEKNGLSTSEIYGMIINLGVNGRVLEETGYGYRDLLGNVNNNCQTINKHKNKIETQVTKGTVYTAVSKNISDKDKEQIKQELIELGMNKDFIDQIDIRNIYIAKKIVEEYDFKSSIGRDINQKERLAIIKAILNKNTLKSNRCGYLTNLIQNMEQIGLNTQEIYGMIIYLGVNRNVLEETGYAYSDLLQNKKYSLQSIEQYKDKMKTKISVGTIYTAVSNNLSEEDQEQIQQELVDIGIDKDFIKAKDIRNVFMAKRIVEGYDFKSSIGRDLNQKEKASLIKLILNNNELNEYKVINNKLSVYEHRRYLTSLICKMEQIELNTQEIYGMIINLGVNGKVIDKIGYGYAKLLGNKNNCCQAIQQYKDKIQTVVTEETIQKAVKKANKKRKVKGKDIMVSTMELTVEGNGGNELCNDAQKTYQELLNTIDNCRGEEEV